MKGLRARALVTLLAVTVVPAAAQIEPPPPIDAKSVAIYGGTGTASVTGRLIAKLPGDKLRYFQHDKVFLAPVIPYTHFLGLRFIRSWSDGTDLNLDPNLGRVTRSTETDGDGRFAFRNLPAPGTYFVWAFVSITDGRQTTGTQTVRQQIGESMAEFDGMPAPGMPIYSYVEVPVQENYTCWSRGVVGGVVDVDGGEKRASFALFVSRNSGC